jgi:hypothetical protein
MSLCATLLPLLPLAVVLGLAALPSSTGHGAPAAPADTATATAREADRSAPWAAPATHDRVKASGRLVVHVLVPFCDNDQVVCGSERAGDPDNLEHNLYWGAVFGQKRFFSRKASSFEKVSVEAGEGPLLERAVFKKQVKGKPWGREDDVTLWVVFDGYRGDAIDGVVDRLYQEAEHGGVVKVKSGDATISLPVDVVGYAGHNRMMDGKKPPARDEEAEGAAIPSFVMACYSTNYFAKPLARRGSDLLVGTRALMAPEGYVIEAIVLGLAEDASPKELRRRAVAAYAKFQKIEEKTAGRIFSE